MTTLLVLVAAGEARAQLFYIGRWQGALEGLVDFSHQDTKTDGAPQATFESLHAEERFSVATSGAHLYDPRLLSLSVGGNVGLVQDDFTSDPGADSSDNGTLWGYDAFADILAEAPYSLNLFANRNQYSLSGPFAGQTDVLTENRGARLLARRLYIPSTATFRQEIIDQESRSGDVVSRRRNRDNIVRYEAQRGWTDKEMDAHYEYIDSKDEVYPDLSYRSHDGSLNYGMDFGPELNRHWESRGRYIDRTGDSDLTDLTTLTVDEFLRVDHTEALETGYRYLLIQTSTSGGESTTHRADATARHRLYDNLTSFAGIGTILQDLPGGRRDTYGGRVDFLYTKQVPHEGRVVAGLGLRLTYEDQKFEEAESFVPQEAHTVSTPFALPIPLDNPFVVESSVVVTKVAFGPLQPGCIAPPGPPTPLVLGRDYTLDRVGDTTLIVPIPCAGSIPGLNPGDAIAVDYRFAVPADLSFINAIWHVDLGVDYGWVRPYYRHQQTDQSLVSGEDGQFLDDQQSDVLGVEFTYRGSRSRASVLAEVQRFVSDRLTYHSVRGAQFAQFRLRPQLILSLNADQSHFDFANPDRKSDAFRGVASLAYAFNARLTADLGTELRVLDDSLVPSEKRIDSFLRVRWFIERIEVSPSLEFFALKRGDTETKQVRLLLRTIRRF